MQMSVVCGVVLYNISSGCFYLLICNPKKGGKKREKTEHTENNFIPDDVVIANHVKNPYKRQKEMHWIFQKILNYFKRSFHHFLVIYLN